MSGLDDLKRSWRALRRAPAYSGITVVTLALGIGLTSAVLSLGIAAFFRPVYAHDPAALFAVYSHDSRDGRRPAIRPNSFPAYIDMRRLLGNGSELAAYAVAHVAPSDGSPPLWSAFVSGNYFDVLGVRPLRGRFIRTDEDLPRGAHPIAVISEEEWMTAYARDENIVGRDLLVGTTAFRIIGVAPSGFNGIQAEGRIQAWFPYGMAAEATGQAYRFDDRGARNATVFGRLKAGATLSDVQLGLDRVARELEATYPKTDADLRLRATSRKYYTSISDAPQVFASALFVLALVGLVHLVVCSNIASLVLSRAAARHRELGILLCLGASRRRVVLQSLVEPAMLAIVGSALGVLVARALVRFATQASFLSALDPGLDPRVLGAVAVLCVGTTIECGVLPALAASREDPLVVMRGKIASRLLGVQLGPTALLVVAQIAVAAVLIGNSVALSSAFEQQTTPSLGWDPTDLWIAEVSPPAGASSVQRITQLSDILTRVSGIRGVTSASVASGAPLLRSGFSADVSAQSTEMPVHGVTIQSVGPGYFKTIGSRVIEGRDFLATDVGSNGAVQPVVAVNVALGRALWGASQSPLGERLVLSAGSDPLTVVGVVPDLRDVSPFATAPEAYVLASPMLASGTQLLVRTVRGDQASARATRQVIADELEMRAGPILRPADQLVSDATQLTRTAGIATTVSAAVAILLCLVGSYGMVSAWAADNRREIAIRIAIGAGRNDVHKLMLQVMGKLVGIGLMIGTVAAIGLVQVERAAFGVGFRFDLVSLLIATASLATMILFTLLFVSRRATLIPPSEALRA